MHSLVDAAVAVPLLLCVHRLRRSCTRHAHHAHHDAQGGGVEQPPAGGCECGGVGVCSSLLQQDACRRVGACMRATSYTSASRLPVEGGRPAPAAAAAEAPLNGRQGAGLLRALGQQG